MMPENGNTDKRGGLQRQERRAVGSRDAEEAFQLERLHLLKSGFAQPTEHQRRCEEAGQATARDASGEDAKRKRKTGGQFSTAFGLVTAHKAAAYVPAPPGLENVTGNNESALRAVAKVLFVMCNGAIGVSFFVGSIALGRLFSKSHRTALRWLRQLESLGVIRRTWTGCKCRRDEQNNEYATRALVNRASEYVFLGLPQFKGRIL